MIDTDLRFDNLANALSNSLLGNTATGMGVHGRDPFTSTQVGQVRLLSEVELRSLYRGSWLIRRIIDAPANDMTRKGVELVIHEGGDEQDAAAAIAIYNQGSQNASPYSRQMSGHDAFRKAKQYADLFGRAYIVLRVNGSENPEKPLRKVRSFEGFSVLDRYQLRPDFTTINPSDPEFYRIARTEGRDNANQDFRFNQRIHHSRVLVFDGAEIHPYDQQLEGDAGHDSVIQGIFEIFNRHYMAKDAISKGLQTYSLIKVSIDGLVDVLAGPGGETALTNMMNSIAQMMSLHKVLVQDAQTSNSDFQERSFTGVKENFQSIVDELTAATGLPFYKIWGTVGKSALADSGGAETRAYAEQVQAWQAQDFMSNHRIVFHAIFEALGTVPSNWEIEYPSIYTETPQEKQENKKGQAETFKLLIESGAVSADEVRMAISTGQDIENVIEVATAAPNDRNDEATPTKRVIDWNGFRVGLQYFPFDKRHGKVLQAGYGHFQKTKGSDGMAVDVYVGTDLASKKVFAIDQVINGKFDEEKMVIGASSIDEAKAIYLSAMPKEFMGEVRELTLKELANYKTAESTRADGGEEHAKKFDTDLFQPDFVRLPSVAYFQELSDIDWAEVRSLADEQGWQWDEDAGQYRDGDDRVTPDEILELLTAELDSYEGQIDALTSLLESGDIDAAQWEERLAEIIAGAAALFFVFGFGNRRNIEPRYRETVKDELLRQYDYLRRFSAEVLSGVMSVGAISARAKLYVHDAELLYNQAQDAAHPVAEFPYVSNRLGVAEHCSECVAETGKGIVLRGQMSMPGTRICFVNCKCSLEYHRTRNDADLLNRRHGWV